MPERFSPIPSRATPIPVLEGPDSPEIDIGLMLSYNKNTDPARAGLVRV